MSNAYWSLPFSFSSSSSTTVPLTRFSAIARASAIVILAFFLSSPLSFSSSSLSSFSRSRFFSFLSLSVWAFAACGRLRILIPNPSVMTNSHITAFIVFISISLLTGALTPSYLYRKKNETSLNAASTENSVDLSMQLKR